MSKNIKIPGQINFIMDDPDMKNALMEIMTQFNMIKKDKIYKSIFNAGLQVLTAHINDLNLKDFEK